MQPLRRYDFDAAILFSDILTIPDAFGQGLYFEEGEGPRFRKVIRTPADVESLPEVSMTRELSMSMQLLPYQRSWPVRCP